MENREILVRPIISEKSLNQAAFGWYTFAVPLGVGKPEIKRAVQEVFKVKVLKVKTMIVKGKTVRAGRRMKTIVKNSWKKALVLLPKDQKIELFAVPGSQEAAGSGSKAEKK